MAPEPRGSARIREIRDAPVIAVLEEPLIAVIGEPRKSLSKGMVWGASGLISARWSPSSSRDWRWPDDRKAPRLASFSRRSAMPRLLSSSVAGRKATTAPGGTVPMAAKQLFQASWRTART